MAPQLEPTRQRVSSHLRAKPEHAIRAGRASVRAKPREDADRATAATEKHGPASKRPRARQPSAQGLLLAFVIGILAMTVAVVVVNAVGHWWILIPVMLVDVAVTFGIIATVGRLLFDGGDDGAD
jgi:Flp pilus assembly protein TadB